MTEAFLYYLWKYKLFTSALVGTKGEQINILKTGTENTDSGPDFFNARLKINEDSWAGNVEMHLRSSDWYRHGHDKDAAYNNTILHVVFEHDKDVFTEDGQELVCLELKGKFNMNSLKRYEYLLHNKNWIPCENSISEFPNFDWIHWMERVMVERLEAKSAFVEEFLKNTNNHWEQAFFVSLAGYFGQKINKLPFQILARSVDLNILAKHKDQLFQIEAILFGQAGMLDMENTSEYQQKLAKEYDFLRKKYKLVSMPYHLWKYMRLRPAAFPDIRIAQLAQLISNRDFLFSKILEINSIKKLEELFDANASLFWDKHYRFQVESKKRVKKLGKTSRLGIIINSVIPFLFVYGKINGQQEYCDRALDLLSQLPAEKNYITKKFTSFGKAPKNALESQAQIQIKQQYCDFKKCLNCGVGLYLLR